MNPLQRMQGIDQNNQEDNTYNNDLQTLQMLMQKYPKDRNSLLEYFMRLQRFRMDKGLNDDQFSRAWGNANRNMNEFQSMTPKDGMWERLEKLPWGRGM